MAMSFQDWVTWGAILIVPPHTGIPSRTMCIPGVEVVVVWHKEVESLSDVVNRCGGVFKVRFHSVNLAIEVVDVGWLILFEDGSAINAFHVNINRVEQGIRRSIQSFTALRDG
jgi:hypothetical protein